MERIRWPQGIRCAHCGGKDIVSMPHRDRRRTKTREGVYRCRECGRQFSVTVNTPFKGARSLLKILERESTESLEMGLKMTSIESLRSNARLLLDSGAREEEFNAAVLLLAYAFNKPWKLEDIARYTSIDLDFVKMVADNCYRSQLWGPNEYHEENTWITGAEDYNIISVTFNLYVLCALGQVVRGVQNTSAPSFRLQAQEEIT